MNSTTSTKSKILFEVIQNLLTFFRDIIVKFEKIKDSQTAFTELSKLYWVSYVETEDTTDEAKFYSA